MLHATCSSKIGTARVHILELLLSMRETVGIGRANFISLSVGRLEQVTQLLHSLSRHLDLSPLLKTLKITFCCYYVNISQMKHQLDATPCRFYFCRVTLHVSGASAHHQEYLKLVQRPLVHVLSLQVSHHISILGPELHSVASSWCFI